MRHDQVGTDLESLVDGFRHTVHDAEDPGDGVLELAEHQTDPVPGFRPVPRITSVQGINHLANRRYSGRLRHERKLYTARKPLPARLGSTP
ncbi:hypothetical protein Apa02nite_008790 [Actinoplanes palleronii]|uniref:Transposase n=1 Tax=Actinoplanes palleronii TaxID=113570 RepID=A0ABQ4B2G8_9ACTN|nr:hypothetical protein Apa02nite_008790 [Actinoplanes palleronii]